MSIPLLIVAGVLVFLIALFFVYSASTFLTKKQKMSQNQKFQAYNKRFRPNTADVQANLYTGSVAVCLQLLGSKGYNS